MRAKNSIESPLIGYTAKLASGKTYGEIIAFYNFGGGDIIEIRFPNGKTEMLPAQEPYLGRVLMEERAVIVQPPEYIEAKPE